MDVAPVVALGSNVIRVAMEFWLRRQKSRSEPLDHFLDTEVADPLDRRRLTRRLESLTDTVIAGLSADAGYEQLDEESRTRVVNAVRSALEQASLSPADLMGPGGMEQDRLLAIIKERSHVSLVLEAEQRVYEVLLAKTVAVLLTVVSVLPESSPYVVAELLRNGDEIDGTLRARLSELPAAGGGDDSYRLALVTGLDQAEIVGFTLPAALRRFSLSRTYSRPRVTVEGEDMPVEWALADFPRLYLNGPAGSGKTALLRWLAVDGARKSLDGLLQKHNELLPVYLPGSRLGAAPEEEPRSVTDFVLQYARPSLRESITNDTLDRRAALGEVIFLLDGLDEFGQKQLPRIRHWLTQLVQRYPKCRLVVSSRQAVIDPAVLTDLGFAVASLNQLDDAGVADLATRWFATVGPVVPERVGDRTAVQLGREVVRVVRSSPQLRELATSPLMCTLICGVYLDRGLEWLQGSDIYAAFVEMMIERRDVERGLGRDRLPRSLASIFLEDLAGHMVGNGWTELPDDRVLDRLEHTRSTLTKPAPHPREVLDSLLVESGVLVEPERGRIRFLHLTFQEYLAAQHFLHNDDIELMVERAHELLWRATLVMAVGQARHRQGDRIVRALADRAERDVPRRATLVGVLEECVRSAHRLDPALRDRVDDLRRRLAYEADTDGERWELWLSTADRAVSESLTSWLLREPALRREGGLVFAEGRLGPDRPVPSGMVFCLSLAARGPILIGALVNAVAAWQGSRPSRDRVELALVVPEAGLTIRISPERLPH
ncbi:NACHT domain-containing protein [Paractinoplanes rhizophilus]|uniref:NACHT domain-containing protein n=1 Tax=Paractinoplanes rhizophilus TaxID=1416877 RepID=A0ABW2HWH5_9ACTN